MITPRQQLTRDLRDIYGPGSDLSLFGKVVITFIVLIVTPAYALCYLLNRAMYKK